MALPQISSLDTQFDVPSSNAVQQEVAKIGEVIEKKVTSTFKSATQSVIGDVPKMIADLTKEIESGPINSFASAMNKLITMVDKLGINLRDYNSKLADTVEEFKGTQEQINQKILEYRQNGIRAEYDQKSGAIKFITAQEVKIRKEEIEKNEKLIAEKQSEITTLTPKLGTDQFVGKTKKGGDKVIKSQESQEKYLKAISDEITKLNEENAKARESIKDDIPTAGQDVGGFSKLTELKEAFMIIPDTITEVFDTFKNVGTKVFDGFAKVFENPMKAFKEIGKSLSAIGGIFKTARIMIALKVLAVVAAFQFFAEKIDQVGAFFIGIWEKITGFFQGIVDWFKNSTVGKFFFGGKDKEEKDKVVDKNAGTAGDMAGETYMEDQSTAPVRSMSSATLEDGLVNQTTQTDLFDYDDNSAKIIAQRQMAGMDGEGTEEIDYTGIRGGTSLSQLGVKKRQVVGNQLVADDTMYGGVSESLKELNAESAAVSQPNVINIQNNSNVNSQQSSGTTVSGFVDHEPDTSFKYIRSGASGSDEF
jgi:hypothetical protein